MIKLCILFHRQEINLVLRYEPKVLRRTNGRIKGLRFHTADAGRAHDYIRYLDWDCVEAVLVYRGTEEDGKEAPNNGKETS
jgi:hypothetical protein